jgi:cell division septation protein DedD
MKKNQKKKPAPKKQPIAYSLTRKGMATWFCLIFFICAWMFVLGVLVGRGSAPVHFDISALQKELADLRQAVIKKDEKRYRIQQAPDVDKPDLGFYEKLKKKKDGGEKFTGRLADSGNAPMPEAVKPVKSVALPETAPAKAKTSLKSLTFKGETVQNKPAKPEVVAKAAQKQAVGQFIIQVAATKASKEADKMTAALKAMGYQAYRVSASIPDKGTWHRVRVAGFQTRADGEAVLKRLKKDGFGGLLLKK